MADDFNGPDDDEMIHEAADPADQTGYGRPPRAHRFKPGASGNPKGRPRGARGLRSELKAELDEYVTITAEGKSRRVRKRRLIIKALAAMAAKGDVRAADKIISLIIQAEGFEDRRAHVERLTVNDLLILDQLLNTNAQSECAVVISEQPDVLGDEVPIHTGGETLDGDPETP